MSQTETIAPADTVHWSGPLMVLMGGICIGFAPIGLRLGLPEFGPQAMAFWRYLFAVPILFGCVLLAQRRLPSRPNRFVILAGIFFALDIGLWHLSLTMTTVSNATFIVNLGNICVGFLAWLFLKERPANLWFVAIALAVCGAAALSLGGGAEAKGNLRGDLIAFAAAILVSFYVLCSKIARRTLGGMEAIFWLTCVEVCVAALLVLGFGESFLPKSAPTWGEVLGGNIDAFKWPFFLTLAVQVAGQGLIITGLGRTPASIAGVLIIVQPVVAAAVSWQLFNEPLTGLQASGAAVILFAVWLAGRAKPTPAPLPRAVKPS